MNTNIDKSTQGARACSALSLYACTMEVAFTDPEGSPVQIASAPVSSWLIWNSCNTHVWRPRSTRVSVYVCVSDFCFTTSADQCSPICLVLEGGVVRVGVSSQYQRALRKPTAAGHEWVVELPVDTRLGDDVVYRTGNRSCHTSRKTRSRWGSR